MPAPHRGIPIPNAPPECPQGMIDNHGRRITYLRLAITDRCNLRCRYCMPEGGVDFVPHAEILTYAELERLVRLISALGVSKIRITGGEPFVRRDCLQFMRRLQGIKTVQSLHVTTNGVATLPHLDGLAELGIAGINLSLDTLERDRFQEITRRDHHAQVLATLEGCLQRRLPLKINTVVQDDTSDSEILAMANLARQHPLSLRFIEIMPFSGPGTTSRSQPQPLRERLQGLLPALVLLVAPQPATARLYTIPGFTGSIGLIEGNSRRFCATCNKIRITPVGMLKSCLYDNGVLDLKALLRGGADDREIGEAIGAAVACRYRDGREAEANCARVNAPAMASIGG